MRIPIKALKELSKKYNLSHVILFAHHPDSKDDHIVTYGKSVKDCSQAADFGNLIKDFMDWPKRLYTQPQRVKSLQKRILELKAENERLRNGADKALEPPGEF